METQKNVKSKPISFETSDLPLASFLKASKLALVGVRKEGNRVFFQFADPKAEALAISFFNDVKVPAASYARAFQEVKTLIYGRVH